ncbi:ATP-binding protein [Leifsonia virtsii]|uniref:ATP-binding protein n=1 Tax=Leifsonia virtsii TaxID=3035915 RepID=A0ABT8IUD0_9MICO|nr:ATP-binding protein [Leifsonia virtsii]MDN4596412.1 ATP-binding protein [Leifsonia virtsii]
MRLSADLAPLADAVAGAVAAARRAGRTPVVLIDGPSGAGKSSLADLLVADWPAEGVPRLVRMDDLYPGWDGLDAGSDAVGRDLLAPIRAHGAGSWQRWDWADERPAGRIHITGSEPLIVEGCGTLSRRNAALADLTVWLRADDALRKRRALARDGATFAAQWDRWQAEFDRFVAREDPVASAMLVLDVTALDLTPAARRPARPGDLTDRVSGTTVES